MFQRNVLSLLNVARCRHCRKYLSSIEKKAKILWFGGLHWKKKLKLGWDPHVDGSLRKILKHQTEVDNNPWWLAPVSFQYDNLYWNK